MCLILDVSGSMDGLLSQAQNEIWKTISFIEGFQKGIYEKWEKAAKLGKGTYANIDQNLGIDAFKTPYDHTLVKFYYDYKSTYFEEKKEERINRFDAKGEVSPAIRDMIIYKYVRMKKAKDIIDKFNENNWEIKQFDDSEIPEMWRNLSPKELKVKLLEFSRKREAYAEGFETYTEKVEEFLQITVQPKLNNKTLNLAMSEMISKQLIEFGYFKK